MQNHEKLIRLAISAGAEKATVIPTESIIVSASFRDICAGNGCGMYGKCWMCPPDIGRIEELIAKLKTYRWGMLYQTVYQIEDSFDIEGMGRASVSHAHVSQVVNDAVKQHLSHFLHLSCGGCHLCNRCAKLDGIPCRQPERALPPMEGYGIDVYQTTKPTELKYINGQNTVTYFGIVLF